MKKSVCLSFLVVFLMGFSSFTIHKFYVSIYQVNYAQEKKMLQITSRIFVDDLNNVLYKKYGVKTFLGEKNESQNDINLMKKYLMSNFTIKVNGQQKAINYVNKEMEGNVLICYYTVKEIPKIKSLEIQNTALFDLNEEQQNIIQTNIYNKKQNLLLTPENVKGLLNQ